MPDCCSDLQKTRNIALHFMFKSYLVTHNNDSHLVFSGVQSNAGIIKAHEIGESLDLTLFPENAKL